MAENLPIDIHSAKLLDWLISRRHCNKHWQKDALVIREKIKHAIQDMPENDRIINLLQGSYINYFHCVEIIDILKETEKDSKNFLGFYSSQRMKDWQEIQSLYKKDNVYLAESAQMLSRLIMFDIPGLKRTLLKSNNAIDDAVKKEKEYLKQSEDARNNYKKELKKLGLKGEALRREFLELASDVPSLCGEISNNIISLNEACQYYSKFRDYLVSGTSTKILPMLNFLNEKGVDVTTFEWTYGTAPERVEPVNFDLLIKADMETNSADDDDEIDFGDDDEIDFGGDDIQIDIIGDDTQGNTNTVARGEEAMSLVENLKTQKQLKVELNELLSFLSMRREDEARETAVDLLIRNTEQRPVDLSKVSVDQMDKWMKKIRDVLEKLNNKQTQHLFNIRSSPQFVEKLVTDLQVKESLEGRCKKMADLQVQEQESMRDQVQQSSIQQKTVIESTRQLQKQIESEISQKYNGRRVNIMAGVNSVA
ncbi:unnamed protein product [Auanema sp. JU1783]|nr:unnamed protein product [Auanema sp. JU1783]